MATLTDWCEGARIRTLPASVAPVILGTGAAGSIGGFHAGRAILAALVAIFFQIGVNFANDYSDGIRGTDEFRSGPPRLTGGGKVPPRTVKLLAFAHFAAACICGLLLVMWSGHYWLLALGAGAVAAAWFYTGGTHPYGYIGLGELFVMVFFGYVATVGTTYTQSSHAPWTAWVGATGVGLIACALLMINNIRDIPTDIQAGKRTLAVRLGDQWARYSWCGLMLVALICGCGIAVRYPVGWVVIIVMAWSGVLARRYVLAGARGRDLIVVLRDTGLIELGYALTLAVALLV
ncbi:1,4-dihydroxy-2-naphthoate polyprenyltransferase [Trueperella sp. LYQ141]|uniref:1,4-dihydroxy-2-naphthoate polyprenyltransferase n=1 Tax=Trueperella sp. LYQ141 TaxID=3391058 RepID=UPI0039832EDA